jgi:nitrile hydratase accessory protein
VAPASAADRLAGLPRDAEGPVFAEPWQAQAFALTLRLHEAGCFAWAEWTAALAAELRRAAECGEPDNDAAHYYDHWVAALEALVTAKGLTDPATLERRKHAWAEAYRRTPHGRPVELRE